ncbi:MAG TPA: lysophospholipid acyltransferase family protein [Flavobacteriales bacterium]|nr:lysophospholipid acyltransferase family protein [Flavobacteriales bacterium]
MDATHEHHSAPLVADSESRRAAWARWLFLPLRWVYKIWFALTFFLSLTVLYVPFRILLWKESRYPKAFKLMRIWARFLGWILFVPLRIRRVGELPPPPYVACLNHSSYLDIIHTYNVLPDYFLFMGKYELLKWPLFNIFFKGMNIAVNRGSRTEAAKSLFKAARALDQGTSVSIFPEGTIPHTAPRMKAFKDGAFKLAIEKQVPIVPITFLDNWRCFGDPEDPMSRARPGLPWAVVHPPISTVGLTEADLDNLRRRTFDAIEAPLRHP